jgi:hypothetical protein
MLLSLKRFPLALVKTPTRAFVKREREYSSVIYILVARSLAHTPCSSKLSSRHAAVHYSLNEKWRKARPAKYMCTARRMCIFLHARRWFFVVVVVACRKFVRADACARAECWALAPGVPAACCRERNTPASRQQQREQLRRQTRTRARGDLFPPESACGCFLGSYSRLLRLNCPARPQSQVLGCWN